MEVTSRSHATHHISPETAALSQELGMHPINIICDPPNAGNRESSGVSFMTAVYEIPRIGERILLDDGKICEVRQVVHKVGTHTGKSGHQMFLLIPTVYSVYVKAI